MDPILIVNAGSSSVKFEVFAIEGAADLKLQVRGQMDGIGTQPRLRGRRADGAQLIDQRFETHEVPDVPSALQTAGAWLREQLEMQPVAVGHRVVHGGPKYARPVLVDAGVLTDLEQYVGLAPLHQPNNLAPIRSIAERFPQLPQVACFDTAFHHGHSAVADHYAIPEHFYARGVRRYGFHGLSYEYIAQRLPAVAPDIAAGRVIVAHLGSGASMCALLNGRSVESTMGFTALDGVPMGTRPGQLDPGVVLFLMEQQGMSAAAIQQLLYSDCGLKGLSGISNDVRDLEGSNDPRAAFALDHFVYRIGLHAGMLAAALGGIDAFVFTAGIGENSVSLRARIAEKLDWLGAKLDANANAARALRISTSDSRIGLFVVPTNEELMIAQHTVALLAQHGGLEPPCRGPAMIPRAKAPLLEGKRGLIVGIANEHSIAWGCAKAFRALGAELAVTYLNEKAKKFVEPLAREAEAAILMQLDVRAPGELEAVFERIKQDWGELDFLVHSIAFSPKEALGGRVVDVSREGFLTTMDVSCWSFIRMAHLAEPLMPRGGTLFTMTYHGSQMVVENYNIMGVAKAALESAVRYLAAELGPKGIRVHAISPGPLATRAASGIPEFDALLDKAKKKAPTQSLVSIDDVGAATAFLAHDAARLITGETLYIDGGYHIID